MNSVRKIVLITSLGLLVAIVIYPLLHESGHSLFAIVLGAEVIEYKLWPIPYVLCNMKGLSSTSQIIVGAGGVLLPILFSACISQRRFWVWYCNILLIGIESLSLLTSLAAIIFFDIGCPITNEDMTTMLRINPSAKPVLFAITLCLLCWLIGMIINSKPLARLKEYLLT